MFHVAAQQQAVFIYLKTKVGLRTAGSANLEKVKEKNYEKERFYIG